MPDPRKVDDPPLTLNERYLNASLSHQLGLRMVASRTVREVLEEVARRDRELAEFLRARLPAIRRGRSVSFQDRSWLEFREDLLRSRDGAMLALRVRLSPELRRLAEGEMRFEVELLRRVTGDDGFPFLPLAALAVIPAETPMNGRLLEDEYQAIATLDRGRVLAAVQDGLRSGEEVDTVVRSVVGTRRSGFTDGALARARRDILRLIKTGSTAFSNAAREMVWRSRPEWFSYLVWTSVLDGRTSHICRYRDGRVAPVEPGGRVPDGLPRLDPPNARPPAHPLCRSIMVSALNGLGLVGKRRFVRDVRTPGARMVDLREIAAREGKSLARVRREWADANVGAIPRRINYEAWLRTQPAEFQRKVLGVAKSRLFRAGAGFEDLADSLGDELTLDELARSNPLLFRAAGLDASDFVAA